ncbi:VTT domain-containing protein [Bradyrhizobium japonicum]|uniref:VTT domain-containing protein n=1 Tax=Bradyrhizobium japonicum TaxID=375 RepID=UPI001FD9CBCD|nr:VTT domain-containing protein [Bradyrhizobium japonicum]
MYIIAWDIHSETHLVGPTGRVDDGLPPTLGPFLKALIEKKPKLVVNILDWDFAALYAAEREWNSAEKFSPGAGGRIRFCLDDSLPLGSAQHQKVVVIDDLVAFVGGLDLTVRRWDTSEHAASNPLRVDHEGKPYPPFHDIQCMVDSDAAAALGEVARVRWGAAGCAVSHAQRRSGNRWPDFVPIDGRDLTVGIARTAPQTTDQPGITEVSQLFEASIATANRLIYIENQFTSANEIALALARRMAIVPSLKVLIVAPRGHSSWFESQAMQGGRRSFMSPFVAAGVTERLRILYPTSEQPQSDAAAIMVHSKVMIVDDGFLRVGSANLNNRSLGADSECDLAFEATCDEHEAFIRSVRHRLIGHFLGLQAREIASNEQDLLGFIDRHRSSGAGKKLVPIEEEGISMRAMTEFVQPIADPRRPLDLRRTARRMWTARTMIAVAGIALSLMGLTLAWQYTSLNAFTEVGYVTGIISQNTQSKLAPLLAISAFVLGGLVVFPVLVLIAATAAALGPWLGFAGSLTGVLLSASLLFMIGRFMGHKRLQSLMGMRALRIQNRIVGKGVVAVALIRMVPIAPFSLVNLLAGASQLTLRDFLIGTILGMAPGIATMAALGAQIADFARNASWSSAVLLGVTIAAWIGVCLGAQFVVTWLAGRKR